MTPLQDIYDAFLQKVDDDFTNKESLVFQYFKSALSKCYKTVRHSLEFDLNETIDSEGNAYDGNFIETLDQDEIELISLYMLYEHKRKKKEFLESQETLLGTKDFKQLPDKVRELTELRQGMKDLKEEINEFKQDFYTYKYS